MHDSQDNGAGRKHIRKVFYTCDDPLGLACVIGTPTVAEFAWRSTRTAARTCTIVFKLDDWISQSRVHTRQLIMHGEVHVWWPERAYEATRLRTPEYTCGSWIATTRVA
ncbi:hypothetical protein AMTR_s00015p00251560 [Amborella trichopoda]|uniref:Uncharacterized protein n=1 Tax=Amborella trichopoda TaxID=13333 RepID=W1PMJ5_AMBTC|nr:hypothetical protein AMTR_s00015p00251560 [Amborella trichopoda]